MTNDELLRVNALQNAAIIAPAGHGKTEMIADLVEHSHKRQLLLTHTNAGVDAITNSVVVKKSRHEKYLFLICFFKSRHEEYFCRSCFFKSGHGQ